MWFGAYSVPSVEVPRWSGALTFGIARAQTGLSLTDGPKQGCDIALGSCFSSQWEV